MSTAPEPVLDLIGIGKSFVGVTALQDARLRLWPGEVHALMGQNGAGKSTLIKVLTGVHPADSGTMRLAGREIRPESPQAAQALGISHRLPGGQPLPQSLGGGEHPRRPHAAALGLDRLGAVRTNLRWRASEPLQIELDVDQHARRIPGGRAADGGHRARRQPVRARADPRRADLQPRRGETERLFTVMRRLRARRGDPVRHPFLEQAYAMADRITVMRNGRVVGEHPSAELSRTATGQPDGRAHARSGGRWPERARPPRSRAR
jgi:monosaccharide-transporting ATPase